MDIEHQLCIGLLKLHVEGASAGTCKGGRQESTNKPSDLPPPACLPGGCQESIGKTKSFAGKICGEKKVNYSCSSIRSSNVTSFFLSFFLLHVVFNVCQK